MSPESLVGLIEGALNRYIEKALTTAAGESLSGVQYEFDRPDIDVTRSGALGGLAIILRNGSPAAETQVVQLLSTQDFAEKLLNVQGSNSIKEDIEESFKQLIQDGKKKPRLPKHSKKPPINREVKTKSTKGLRDLRGKFYSPVSLLVLLNVRLHEQIKLNMGKGSAKSVLNYRSGRFAKSASVKTLVVDKAGAVSVFYTYMKYPYQTFEPGYKQGQPLSRDPRLLIGRSIRQLAAQTITNKLRSVSV